MPGWTFVAASATVRASASPDPASHEPMRHSTLATERGPRRTAFVAKAWQTSAFPAQARPRAATNLSAASDDSREC